MVKTSTAAVNALASENQIWIQKLQLKLICSQQICLQIHLFYFVEYQIPNYVKLSFPYYIRWLGNNYKTE